MTDRALTDPAGDISVVIPFFNGDLARLAATLDRVRGQTCRPFEVIIVDDGSAEDVAGNLAVLARAVGALLIRQKNAGPGAARNRGAAAARGRWLAFLDADDLWHPDKLSRQRAEACRLTGVPRLILCDTVLTDAGGARLRKIPLGWVADVRRPETLLLDPRPVHSFTSAIFLARNLFESLGGFSPVLRYREDQLFLLTALARAGVAVVPATLSERVLHRESFTAQTSEATAAVLYARQVRFAAEASRLCPGRWQRWFLGREAARIARRLVRSGAAPAASGMVARALCLSPLSRRSWATAAEWMLALGSWDRQARRTASVWDATHGPATDPPGPS